nr:hypothetical protein [Lachnospiraceae bacterium]
MKILVIGGSYFLGRWFVQHAYREHEITVLNRGNIPINLEGVKEIKADRHIKDKLCKLKSETGKFEAVVDFCAYEQGDISGILCQLNNPPDKYIFISTVDVYEKGSGAALEESSALADLKNL